MNFWKRQRERIGKTQQDVGDAVQKTKALVSAWERDVAVPPIALTEAIAAAYGITKEYARLQIEKQSKRIRGHRSTKVLAAASAK